MPRPLKLRKSFFDRPVLEAASELIGATLIFASTGGVIVEVEAYHESEPAAHAYGGKTKRNAVMFGPPGYAYVYRCYGLHWCVNFVCERKGSASAILLRALEPTTGLSLMQERRGTEDGRLLCSGPGRLTQAMGMTHVENGLSLDEAPFLLLARTCEPEIVSGPRIGITKAIDLPWRFGLRGSRFLSKPFRSSP